MLQISTELAIQPRSNMEFDSSISQIVLTGTKNLPGCVLTIGREQSNFVCLYVKIVDSSSQHQSQLYATDSLTHSIGQTVQISDRSST